MGRIREKNNDKKYLWYINYLINLKNNIKLMILKS